MSSSISRSCSPSSDSSSPSPIDPSASSFKIIKKLLKNVFCQFCSPLFRKAYYIHDGSVYISCSNCQEHICVKKLDIPAPRLVGIELNPGPKTEKKLLTKVQQLLKTKRKNRNNRTKSKSKKDHNLNPYWAAGVGDTQVRAYISLLADPFSQKNMRTGFCTMTETVLGTGYFKENYITTAADDGFVAIMNPDAVLSPNGSTATGFNAALASFYSRGKFLGASNVTSGALQTQAVNSGTLTSQMRCNRIVAGALRVVISYPMTSSAPDIASVRLNGCIAANALDSSTPNSVINLPQSCTRTGSGGDVTIQKNWLPSDPEDYGFSPNSIYSNGESIYNPVVISGSGLPVGTRVFIECITHIEGMQGQLTGATQFAPQHDEKYDPDPTVSDAFSSPSHLWKSVKGIAHEASSAIEWGLGAANAALNVVDHAKTSFSNPRFSRIHGTYPSSGMVSEIKMIE